jgi:hypothetical protein
LRLDGLVSSYGGYIGAAFLISSAILAIELGIAIYRSVSRWRRRRRSLGDAVLHLANLDAQERAVMREFVIQGQSTIQLPFAYPVVAGLIEKGLIEQVGNAGEQTGVGPVFSFAIRKDLDPLIEPAFIDLPTERTEENIRWLREHRPAFAARLAESHRMHYAPLW